MEFQTFPLTQIQQTAYEYLDAGSNRCAVYRLEGELDELRLAGRDRADAAALPAVLVQVHEGR